MTSIKAIHTVKDFLRENVCPNIKYLLPDKEDGREYIETYVNPQVFAFYEPSNERLPEGVEYTTPGIIVQLQQGEDHISANQSNYRLELSFCTWRPGKYTQQNNTELCDIAQKETQISIEYSADINRLFTRNEDGWQDVYHFMEETKKAIISAGHIGDLKFKLDEPVKYGPYTKDGALIDFYPYYYLWMSFTLETIVTPVTREYDDLL